ncbi:MAG: hypothetical protein ABI643_01660 [Candidatus Doudnabacteria bacterium]
MAAKNFESESDESELEEEGAEIEDIIGEIASECSAIFDNPENGDLLSQIFEMARGHYDKDRKGWDELLSDLKTVLAATDDDDIHDILQDYNRKVKLELS